MNSFQWTILQNCHSDESISDARYSFQMRVNERMKSTLSVHPELVDNESTLERINFYGALVEEIIDHRNCLSAALNRFKRENGEQELTRVANELLAASCGVMREIAAYSFNEQQDVCMERLACWVEELRREVNRAQGESDYGMKEIAFDGTRFVRRSVIDS